ncbi:AP-1 complex subunit beta-1 [Varanus komodoensis]|nr:AP-1 complex subunit beta-1 [Varanus komodoensis]
MNAGLGASLRGSLCCVPKQQATLSAVNLGQRKGKKSPVYHPHRTPQVVDRHPPAVLRATLRVRLHTSGCFREKASKLGRSEAGGNFGLAPAAPLQVHAPLAPNQSVELSLPLNTVGSVMKMDPLNNLQVAVKNNIDVFYFSTLYPLHILFVEDGKMGRWRWPGPCKGGGKASAPKRGCG